MHLPHTALLAELTVLASTDSTNTTLLARGASAEEFTTVVTTNQTAGKGRLGRVWVSHPGKGVAISVLLRPRRPNGAPLELATWSWLPLLAGLAMTRSVSELLGNSASRSQAGASTTQSPSTTLKWPNDVLVGGEKVSGILAELLPSGDGLVIGAGVNLLHTADELPTPTSTSLALQGTTVGGELLVDAVCSVYLRELRGLYRSFTAFDGDAQLSGLWASVSERCSTLGAPVRVHLPAGPALVGEAVDLDSSGRLRIRSGSDAVLTAVSAGDVEHLRYI